MLIRPAKAARLYFYLPWVYTSDLTIAFPTFVLNFSVLISIIKVIATEAIKFSVKY